MKSCRPVVLVYAQDAGGARAILPVVKSLVRPEKYRLCVIVHLFAIEVFKAHDIEVVPLETLVNQVPLSIEGACDLLSRLSPDVIFCTTSNNNYDPSNGYIIMAARQLGLKSFALMDDWRGWHRIHDEDKNFSYLPDVLGVIDARSRDQGIAEGVSSSRMVVVGSPHLEMLLLSKRDSEVNFRRENNLGKEDFICSLFTQPVFTGLGRAQIVEPFLKGERLPIIEEALRLCEEKIRKAGHEAIFFLRLHPREREVWGTAASPFPNLKIDSGPSALDVVFSSNLILGFDSMILYEAICCGRPTISLRLDSLSDVLGASANLPGTLCEVCSFEGFSGLLDKWFVKGEWEKICRAPFDGLPMDSVDSCISVLEKLSKSGLSADNERRGGGKR